MELVISEAQRLWCELAQSWAHPQGGLDHFIDGDADSTKAFMAQDVESPWIV